MFSNLGLPELLVIVITGLVVIGPHRLPKFAADAARILRQLRTMADGAVSSVRTEFGPEFQDLDLRSLHPRNLINSVLSEEHPPSSEATETGEVVAASQPSLWDPDTT